MKYALAALPLMMCACQTQRRVTLPNGAEYIDNGHFAGDTLVMIEPDGTTILRNKMNKPWQDFLQAAAAAVVSHNGASVTKATVASREATRIARQKAAVDTAAINAETEQLRIVTDGATEALRITTPIRP